MAKIKSLRRLVVITNQVMAFLVATTGIDIFLRYKFAFDQLEACILRQL